MKVEKKASWFVCLGVVAVALMALIGWFFGIPFLTRVIPGLPTMKFNTAICFLIAGISVCASYGKKKWTKQSIFLALLILIVSGVTLCQYFFNLNLGIDQFFIKDSEGVILGKKYPGRMSEATAVCFILLSVAIVIIKSNRNIYKIFASYVLHLVTIISFLAIVGFFFAIPTLAKISFISSMAIHTSIAFLILSISVSLLIPSYGFTSLFVGVEMGHVMLRRLFLRLVIGTLLFSYLIIYLYRNELLSGDFAIAILGVAFVGVIIIVLALNVKTINQLERERFHIQEELMITNTYLNGTPDPTIIVNNEGYVEMVNGLVKEVFGYELVALKNKPIEVIISTLHKSEFSKAIMKCLTGKGLPDGLPETSLEVHCNHNKGNEIPVAVTMNRIETQKGIMVTVSLRDITRSVTAERKLEKANQKIQAALNASVVGIWEYDLHTGKLVWDQMMYELYGITQYENIGNVTYEMWRSKVHPDDIDQVEATLQQVLEHDTQIDLTYRVIWEDGTVHFIRERAVVFCDEKGKPFQILGTNWDTTVQKEFEQALQKSVEQNRLFIDEAPSAIAMFDTEMKYMAASNKWKKDYQIKEDILGKSHYDVFPEIGDEWKKIHQECLHGATNTCDEAKFERADGSIQWITWEVKPWFKNEYEIGGLLMFTSNITQFKESVMERLRLQNLLEQSNEIALIGSWEVDLLKQKVFWSSITKQIHEVEESFEPTFQEAINFYIEEDRDVISQKVNEVLKYGGAFDVELQICTSANNIKWVRSVGRVEKVDNKNRRLYGIFQDITKLKEYESSLVKARNLAEIANKSKSEFLANMSHEIRTPLNGIIGFTDLLVTTPLTESQKEYVKTVNSSANLLLDVINDILDFSKIEAGKLELHPERTDIYELCRQTIDIIKYQAEEKGLEILLDIEPSINRFIEADSVRLRQVLTNLLNNSVKFTENGEIELKIVKKHQADEIAHEVFGFYVRDTGVGIAPDKLEKIFGAFDQEDGSTTRKYGGTGLGLTISNKLLGLMNSELKVSSVLGVGTTFSFKIAFKSYSDSSICLDTAKKYEHVLVIDDNENNRKILKGMLSEAKCTCDLAVNAIDAIEILENNKTKYDLVIVDYHMPYMNGIDFIKYVRKDLNLSNSELSIMLLHSMSDDQLIVAATNQLQINYTYTKPITLVELIKIINPEAIGGNSKYIVKEEVNNKKENKSNLDTKVHILIAEDNKVNQMLALELLGRIIPEATLTIAENGREAVELFKKHNFDLIFMDVQMPELSGIEATKLIRTIEKDNVHTIIVALTARVFKEEKDICLDAGMDDYLTKPIRFELMQELLKKYIT